jgi:hypothetical protein
MEFSTCKQHWTGTFFRPHGLPETPQLQAFHQSTDKPLEPHDFLPFSIYINTELNLSWNTKRHAMQQLINCG